MVPIADGVVGVRQAAAPDRLIDNEVLTVSGNTVYRQRVTDPDAEALLTSLLAAVQATISASVTGTVALDAATLAALENIVVSGTVLLDAATLAALESITASISGTVTVDSELPAAAALADNTANPTAPAVAAFPLLWDGATWDRSPGSAADGTLVNLGANNDVVVADDVVSGAVATATGASTTVLTPGAGNALRIKWVHLATSENNSAETVVTVKLGSTVIYRTPLGTPGIFSHKAVRVGAANETLTVELSDAAQTVYVNVDYEEFTP